MELVLTRYLEDVSHFSFIHSSSSSLASSDKFKCKELMRLKERATQSALHLIKETPESIKNKRFLMQFLALDYGMRVLLDQYTDICAGMHSYHLSRVI